MRYLTRTEIQAYQPDPLPPAGCTGLAKAQNAMQATGCGSIQQQMGSRWPIGCVALEITQRCNLDCTLCYLSEHSEAIRDIPVAELLRRIEMIYRYYGRHTDVQITGGDPTLRKHDELRIIVSKIKQLGMRSTLMTNGIKATRSLLAELAEAGLLDVAFHVDTTQGRKGYRTESELNEIRQQYIDRTRDLPLSVMFNTTVHDGNFHEIPALVKFFKSHAGKVRTASFQLQADTGRGIARGRGATITPATVAQQIQRGAAAAINFGSSLIGHPNCNRYGLCLAVNGALYDLLDEPAFIERIQPATAHIVFDRAHPQTTVKQFASWLVTHPRYLLPSFVWAGKKLWQIKKNLLAARGRINTISFVIHNFMDADSLERERIQACVFKTMTAQGPLSMCLYNANRDHYILQPVPLAMGQDQRYWQPLTGAINDTAQTPRTLAPEAHELKHLKGRARRKVLDKLTATLPLKWRS